MLLDQQEIAKWALMCGAEAIEHRKNSWELYGFDFMVDEDYNAWLIEINSSPACDYSTTVTERYVQKALVEILDIVLDVRDWEAQSKKQRQGSESPSTGGWECIYKGPTLELPAGSFGTEMTLRGEACKGLPKRTMQNIATFNHVANSSSLPTPPLPQPPLSQMGSNEGLAPTSFGLGVSSGASGKTTSFLGATASRKLVPASTTATTSSSKAQSTAQSSTKQPSAQRTSASSTTTTTTAKKNNNVVDEDASGDVAGGDVDNFDDSDDENSITRLQQHQQPPPLPQHQVPPPQQQQQSLTVAGAGATKMCGGLVPGASKAPRTGIAVKTLTLDL